MGLCELTVSHNFLFFGGGMIALFTLPSIIIESTAKV